MLHTPACFQVDTIKTGKRDEPQSVNENNMDHRDFIGGEDTLWPGPFFIYVLELS